MQLRRAPGARRADTRALLQITKRRSPNQPVMDVRARQHRRNDKNVGAPCFDVFHRMDGDINLIIDQRAFQLLSPKRFPANIGERPVLNLVARRQHWNKRHRVIGQIMRRFHRRPGHLGLGQSQRRTTGSDA